MSGRRSRMPSGGGAVLASCGRGGPRRGRGCGEPVPVPPAPWPCGRFLPRGRLGRPRMARRAASGAPPDGSSCRGRVGVRGRHALRWLWAHLRPHPLPSVAARLRVPGPSAGHLRMSNAVSCSAPWAPRGTWGPGDSWSHPRWASAPSLLAVVAAGGRTRAGRRTVSAALAVAGPPPRCAGPRRCRSAPCLPTPIRDACAGRAAWPSIPRRSLPAWGAPEWLAVSWPRGRRALVGGAVACGRTPCRAAPGSAYPGPRPSTFACPMRCRRPCAVGASRGHVGPRATHA